jgi:hypothetical protein
MSSDFPPSLTEPKSKRLQPPENVLRHLMQEHRPANPRPAAHAALRRLPEAPGRWDRRAVWSALAGASGYLRQEAGGVGVATAQ